MHKGPLFVQIGKIRLRGLSRLLVEGSAPKPLYTHILCGSASFGCLWNR